MKLPRMMAKVLPICLVEGHDIVSVDGSKNKLVYQKGDKRPAMEYYSGTLEFCQRKECDWERYTGPRTPYERVFVKGKSK